MGTGAPLQPHRPEFPRRPGGTAAPTDSVRGGEQSIYALGVNWYLNTNVKLMLNYLHVDVNRLNPAAGQPDTLRSIPGHTAARRRDRPEPRHLFAAIAVQLLNGRA